MTHRFLTLLAAIMLMALAAGKAEARRGFVPIPGGSEILVKVVDMPHTPEFLLRDGKHIDLGYKFNTYWQGGEWIGHIGSDSQYISLDATRIAAMLKAANLSALPPVPSKPWTFASGFWLVLLGVLAIAGLFKAMRANPRQQPSASPALQGGAGTAANAEPVPAGKAHAALDSLLREREANAAGTAAPQQPRPAPGAPRAAFGRRV